MNLFKNELFNPTMPSGLPPRGVPSYRAPLFAPRYGRRRPVSGSSIMTSVPVMSEGIRSGVN